MRYYKLVLKTVKGEDNPTYEIYNYTKFSTDYGILIDSRHNCILSYIYEYT